MKLFPQDDGVEIYKTGFEDDILERRKLSKRLSELVERLDGPVVFALDDTWGSGKSYFLKRWVAAHTKENDGDAITVYFDAFESDYLGDPLVSIMAAVSERIPAKQKATLDRCKEVATKLAKPTLGVALSLATFGAKQQFDEIGDIVAEEVSAEARGLARNLWVAEERRREALKDFRDSLGELTKTNSASIVIIIDELDRCRPDYALSVLEVIKHLFAVKGVHFVLGVNSKALESSVSARYGAEIDAEAYLRKFIHVSFSLPRSIGHHSSQAVIVRYTEWLASEMELPRKISQRCINLISYTSISGQVSLRDAEKIFSKIALLPEKVLNRNLLEGWLDILCLLLVSSVANPRLYVKLSEADATEQEIRAFLGASKQKTIRSFDGEQNREFDHGISHWLLTALTACALDSSIDHESLPFSVEQSWGQFSDFGDGRNVKDVPATIQRDWMNLFAI